MRVRARFAQKLSNPSSGPWREARQTVLAAGASATPNGLTAAINDGDVVLSWDNPNDPDISGYRVLRGEGADSLNVIHNDTATSAVTHADATPNEGQSNTYAIKAREYARLSQLPSTGTITPPEARNGLLAVVGESDVNLNWTAPGNGTITGHQILRSPATNTMTVPVDNTGSTDTSYNDDSGQNPGTVLYAVRARTATGNSRHSFLVVVAIPAPAATPTPADTGSEDITLVSNVKSSPLTNPAIVGQTTLVQSFRTGSPSEGYVLQTVGMEINPQSGNPTITVSIHADSNGSVGDQLHALTAPENLDADVDVLTAPEGATLEANTTCWLVIRRSDGSTGEADLEINGNPGRDLRIENGFSLFQGVDQNPHDTAAKANSDLVLGTSQQFRPFLVPNNQVSNPVRVILRGQDMSDVPATTASQATMKVGVAYTGEINLYADQGCHPVALEANKCYVFNVAEGTAIPLYYFGVHDSSGTKQTIFDTDRYVDSSLSDRAYFTPTSAGTYYSSVGVWAYAGNPACTDGTYTVQESPADPKTATTSTSAGGSYPGELTRSTTA